MRARSLKMVTCETAAFTAAATTKAVSMHPPTREDCCGSTSCGNSRAMKHDWTLSEVRAVHDLPLLDLVHRAQTVHRENFGDNKVQLCSLLSVKTGGCPEDCAYCPQAARYHTGVEAEPLMQTDDV